MINVYGSRSIFLLFCFHRDIVSGWQEMEISVARPVSTNKNIKGCIETLCPSDKMWGRVMAINNIYGYRAIVLLFCVHQDTKYE